MVDPTANRGEDVQPGVCKAMEEDCGEDAVSGTPVNLVDQRRKPDTKCQEQPK